MGKGVFGAWRTRHRIGSSTVSLSDKMDASESTSAGHIYRADQGNMPKVNSKILRQKFQAVASRLTRCGRGRAGWGFGKIGSDARRHLDTKQKAVFGRCWHEYEKVEAKERQKGGQGGVLLVETFPQGNGKSRDKAGCLSVLLTTGIWLVVVAAIEFCCQERSVATCCHFGMKVSAKRCN